MLVLTRKKSEAIRIGNDVFIKVIRTGRSTVKIGIDAPANVRVVRGELVITHPLETTGNRRDISADVVADEDVLDATCSDQFPEPHIVSPTGV
jgi:carbon storage regulator CsrA